MSSFNLTKKLLPGKKAWKSFTNTLQKKLGKLKISQTLKNTTRRVVTLRSIRPLLPPKLRALARRSSTYHHHIHRYHHHQFQKRSSIIYVDELFPEPVSMQTKQVQSLMEPSYKVKEMAASSSTVKICPISRDKIAHRRLAGGQEPHALSKATNMQKQKRYVTSSSVNVAADKKALSLKSRTDQTSKIYVVNAEKATSLAQIRGVDERAEEFISNFREQMKLQREQSILDFQEMLARST